MSINVQPELGPVLTFSLEYFHKFHSRRIFCEFPEVDMHTSELTVLHSQGANVCPVEEFSPAEPGEKFKASVLQGQSLSPKSPWARGELNQQIILLYLDK